jgi:geranylgeranyl reductase family protein
MSEKVDACIVGAGPAGSIAAERLAQTGAHVLLLDAQKFPRYKCCAAGVLWHNIADFPEIEPVIENFNYKMVIHPPSRQREFFIESDDHYLLGQTYRATLDDHLAKLAVKAGVEFREEHRVDKVRLLDGNGGISISVHDIASETDYEVEAKIVIGADGVKSAVRKTHPDFQHFTRDQLLIASELDVPIDEARILETYGDARAVHMYLFHGDLPGYAWIFTKKKSVSLGMGTMLCFKGQTNGGKALTGAFASFCNELEASSMIPAGSVHLGKTSYALIPSMPTNDAETHGRRALLAGDAGGVFVSALSGEGIYYSCLSGNFAAETAARALKSGDFSVKALESYPRAWKARLTHELDYQYWAKGYMLESKRRCEKAVRWGMYDDIIRRFLSAFFAGSYAIDRRFMTKLVGQYVRLKIKDRLGMMGPRERKEDYPEEK